MPSPDQSQLRHDCEHALSRDITLSDVGDMWRIGRLYAEFLDTLLEEVHRDQDQKRSVRILDFDILYAAMWRALPAVPTTLDRMVGLPQSTYHFLTYNRRPFCLPMGTEMEMAECTLHLSRSARGLAEGLRHLRFAYDSDDNAAGGTLQRTPESWEKDIRGLHLRITKTLEEIARDHGDLGLLRKLTDSSHRVDWPSLSKGHPLQAKHRTLLEYLQRWFNDYRPQRVNANLADAYNLAWYCAVCERDDDWVPIFASGTRAVLEAPIDRQRNRWSTLPARGLGERPVIVSRYLTFSTAFEQYCEYQPRRQLTLATAARAALEPVLDAERVLRLRGIKPEWVERDGRLKPIPWPDFADIRTFRIWATEFLNWRHRYLDSVLGIFEYYGTTDRQLRNTFLQLRCNWLDRTIAGGREQFQQAVETDDWFTDTVARIGRVSYDLAVKLRESDAGEAAPRRSWKESLTVTKSFSGEPAILDWTVRSVATGTHRPLIACIRAPVENKWELTWPTHFDLDEAIRLGPYLIQLLGRERPTSVGVSLPDGTVRTIAADDAAAIRDCLHDGLSDFEVFFDAGELTVSFTWNYSTFPERQGVDVLLHTAVLRPQEVAEVIRLTGRHRVERRDLQALLEEAFVVCKSSL